MALVNAGRAGNAVGIVGRIGCGNGWSGNTDVPWRSVRSCGIINDAICNTLAAEHEHEYEQVKVQGAGLVAIYRSVKRVYAAQPQDSSVWQ